LVFNEGYNSINENEIIRFELCEEAIRLTEIILSNQNISNKSSSHALLALMYFNTSRFKSRIDEFDNIVTLEHQDRTLWDKSLIQKGINHLGISTQDKVVSIYHILATISAHYCTSKNYNLIDWIAILSLYDNLIELDKSPIILLNRAIIISKVYSPKEGIKALEEITDSSTLLSYLPYFSSKAELYFLNNQKDNAISLLNEALNLPLKKAAKSHILNTLKKYTQS